MLDDPPVDHPAEYSAEVLVAITQVLDDYLPVGDSDPPAVLDPYAGRGSGVEWLAGRGYQAAGVELEPEWAEASPLVITGDVLTIAERWPLGRFDAIVTSPCYGNRMADHHDAKDACKACVPGVGQHPSIDESGGACRTCGGSGLSKRVTYAHRLGRTPSDGSAAVLQWGRAYRDHHQLAVSAMFEVLKAGEDGLLVVNMKNHVRGGAEQLVTEWWLNHLLVRGCRILEVRRVPTPGMGFGANGHLRTECEFLIVVRPPANRGML